MFSIKCAFALKNHIIKTEASSDLQIAQLLDNVWLKKFAKFHKIAIKLGLFWRL